MKLNLGCSDAHLPGYINVDICEPADQVVDLRGTWPWDDSSVDEIVAHDIIEHLPNKIFTMNELWRVLKPGAVVKIKVPTTDGTGAWQDPTHVSYWNRPSFWYYTKGDPHRERFGKAYGVEARFEPVHEQVHRWRDIPTLEIHLLAFKEEAPQTFGLNLDRLNALAGCTVLGAMRIKNESRWIKRSIESQLDLCDKVLVLDDHSTDDTRDIVRGFGTRCVLIESTFEGVNEGRDKSYLLSYLVAADPEWVLWIDGDEVLEKRAHQTLLREMSNKGVGSLSMKVLYFWDDENKFRADGVYANMTRPSAFRVRGQDPAKLHFPRGDGSANLHNGGNCPQGVVGVGALSEARIKHYGYLTWEERQRKYEFYNKVDPNNEAEDCYRHIIEIPGARHAPGPTVLQDWVEES